MSKTLIVANTSPTPLTYEQAVTVASANRLLVPVVAGLPDDSKEQFDRVVRHAELIRALQTKGSAYGVKHTIASRIELLHGGNGYCCAGVMVLLWLALGVPFKMVRGHAEVNTYKKFNSEGMQVRQEEGV